MTEVLKIFVTKKPMQKQHDLSLNVTKPNKVKNSEKNLKI